MPYKFLLPQIESYILVTHDRWVADQVLAINRHWTSIHVSYSSEEWQKIVRCDVKGSLYKLYSELPEDIRDWYMTKKDLKKMNARMREGEAGSSEGFKKAGRTLGSLRRMWGNAKEERDLRIVAWTVDLNSRMDKKKGTNELDLVRGDGESRREVLEDSKDSWERDDEDSTRDYHTELGGLINVMV